MRRPRITKSCTCGHTLVVEQSVHYVVHCIHAKCEVCGATINECSLPKKHPRQTLSDFLAQLYRSNALRRNASRTLAIQFLECVVDSMTPTKEVAERIRQQKLDRWEKKLIQESTSW